MNKWNESTTEEQISFYNKEIWFVVSVWTEHTDCELDAPETTNVFLNVSGLSTDEALECLEKLYGLSKSEMGGYPGDNDYVIAYYFHENREYVVQHGSGSDMDLIIDGLMKEI